MTTLAMREFRVSSEDKQKSRGHFFGKAATSDKSSAEKTHNNTAIEHRRRYQPVVSRSD